MTLLRTGFFFSKSTWTPEVLNAAPTISSVVLNFDLRENSAPVGENAGFVFDVLAGNAAPMTSTVTLNFDLIATTANTAPEGQDQNFVFDVAAA